MLARGGRFVPAKRQIVGTIRRKANIIIWTDRLSAQLRRAVLVSFLSPFLYKKKTSLFLPRYDGFE